MLYIKTKLGQSAIHGVGLFAAEFVPKGTVTWKYHPLFDTGFTEEQIKGMTPPALQIFLHYAYFDYSLNKYILCFDDQRFINHSTKHFNIESTPEMDIAAKDIQEGEELFCDYYKFDENYFERRGIKKEHLKEPR